MGAAPPPGRLTIDPDATYVSTYGKQKEGSTFSYQGEIQMSPLVAVVGETGDVRAIRARGGNASPRKKLATFCDQCVAAIPNEARDRYELWVRTDSAVFSKAAVDKAISHGATFTITAEQNPRLRRAIETLALDTAWVPAERADGELSGAEVAETSYRFATADLRLIVRRQAKAAGEQLSFDDLGGRRFFAFITNAGPEHSTASLDLHHRQRGGASEEAIRQLKEDFGMNHALVRNFTGNWVWCWPPHWPTPLDAGFGSSPCPRPSRPAGASACG